ncbi:MAG: Crp/Fnr family transcriptional regulator [Candidatus Metalachnospira sp.]|nr:Crp/Fnr family transcriptional regulator [Candidatus Metalachnospira sp.]
MEFKEVFPIWDKLKKEEQSLLENNISRHKIKKNEILHRGFDDCIGLVVVISGRFRAYIISDSGREVTLYRLFERDICLLSASCVLSGIQFEISIEAEENSEFYIIPPNIFNELMEQSAAVANYANKIMASRFSDVMWLMDQIMFKSFDVRLAEFLLEESNVEQSDILTITHEKIANHMGSAREVVSRMLKYFQTEGIVKLSRGNIEIADRKRLETMAE